MKQICINASALLAAFVGHAAFRLRQAIRSVGALAAVLCLSVAAQAAVLTTPVAPNNKQNGIMFDVMAAHAVTVTQLAIYAEAGDPTFEIWTRAGTHVGHEGSNTGWTLLGTSPSVSVAADGVVSIPLALNVPIAEGDRQAFYVTVSNGTYIRYQNSSGAIGDVFASDANLSIHSGTGMAYPFVTGGWVPRDFIGSITYDDGVTPPPPR